MFDDRRPQILSARAHTQRGRGRRRAWSASFCSFFMSSVMSSVVELDVEIDRANTGPHDFFGKLFGSECENTIQLQKTSKHRRDAQIVG